MAAVKALYGMRRINKEYISYAPGCLIQQGIQRLFQKGSLDGSQFFKGLFTARQRTELTVAEFKHMLEKFAYLGDPAFQAGKLLDPFASLAGTTRRILFKIGLDLIGIGYQVLGR